MSAAEFLSSLKDEPFWEQVTEVQVNSRDITGDSPLHWALWRKDEQVAVELVLAGAEVNARGEEGYTPLHVAIESGCVAVVRLLSERGGDWDVRTDIGHSARELAADSDTPALRAFNGGAK